jgi:adenosylcobinamide-GDP ribazoletransferase
MGLTNGIRDVVGFLTIIPVRVREDSLRNAAEHMYLFPLIGGFIGLIAGLLGWVLTFILPRAVAGVLTLGFLLLCTGLHHIDGLADFGDALMVQGTSERKLQVMKDIRVGVGGLVFTLIVILTSAACIAQIPSSLIIQSLIVSEVAAKFSMVMLAWMGISAREGINTYFVNAMHSQHRVRLIITTLSLSFALSVLTLPIMGIFTLISGMVTGIVVLLVANRQLKGVTGDVFGAANEVSRMASLIMIASGAFLIPLTHWLWLTPTLPYFPP